MPDRRSRLSRARPRSLFGPDTTMRCGSHRNRSARIPRQLLEREQAQLVHPVVDQRLALGLRRQHGDQADHVAREAGPQAGGQAADGLDARFVHLEAVGLELDVQLHPLQDGGDRLHVHGRTPRTSTVPPVIGRDDRPAAGFDVVAVQAMRRALAVRPSLDPDRRRAGAFDRHAHRLQELAQLDDVRLGRGVADLGRALGRGGGEHRRLGAGDRRLVEIERGARAARRARPARSPTRRRRARRARPAPARASRWCAASGSRRPAAPGARGRCARAAGPSAAPTRAGARPASASGVSLVTVGVEISSVGVPSPLTRAPTPVSRSAITRMSEMRGTFSRRHGLVAEQAGGDQRQRRVLVAVDGDAAGRVGGRLR